MRYTTDKLYQASNIDTSHDSILTISLSVEFPCRAKDQRINKNMPSSERVYALVGLHSDVLNTLLLLGGLTFLRNLQHSLQCVDEEDGDEDERYFEL